MLRDLGPASVSFSVDEFARPPPVDDDRVMLGEVSRHADRCKVVEVHLLLPPIRQMDVSRPQEVLHLVRQSRLTGPVRSLEHDDRVSRFLEQVDHSSRSLTKPLRSGGVHPRGLTTSYFDTRFESERFSTRTFFMFAPWTRRQPSWKSTPWRWTVPRST